MHKHSYGEQKKRRMEVNVRNTIFTFFLFPVVNRSSRFQRKKSYEDVGHAKHTSTLKQKNKTHKQHTTNIWKRPCKWIIHIICCCVVIWCGLHSFGCENQRTSDCQRICILLLHNYKQNSHTIWKCDKIRSDKLLPADLNVWQEVSAVIETEIHRFSGNTQFIASLIKFVTLKRQQVRVRPRMGQINALATEKEEKL